MDSLGFKSSESFLSGVGLIIAAFVIALIILAFILRSNKGRQILAKNWQGNAIAQCEKQQIDRETCLYRIKTDDATYLVLAKNNQLLVLENDKKGSAQA